MNQDQETAQASTTVTATTEELAAAFALWETEFREAPEGFYTPEEVAALKVADVSQARAIALQAYLRKVQS